MTDNPYWDTLLACPIADEALYQIHIEGFVSKFVIPGRRERWLHTLGTRPKRAHRDSHRLHSDLDRSRCYRSFETEIAKLPGVGVYYAFTDEPRMLVPSIAASICTDHDGLLSLIPGKLAVYFFHEIEVWECRS